MHKIKIKIKISVVLPVIFREADSFVWYLLMYIVSVVDVVSVWVNVVPGNNRQLNSYIARRHPDTAIRI
jgi:hypothetical protein